MQSEVVTLRLVSLWLQRLWIGKSHLVTNRCPVNARYVNRLVVTRHHAARSDRMIIILGKVALHSCIRSLARSLVSVELICFSSII